jgi:hypothetical protein
MLQTGFQQLWQPVLAGKPLPGMSSSCIAFPAATDSAEVGAMLSGSTHRFLESEQLHRLICGDQAVSLGA